MEPNGSKAQVPLVMTGHTGMHCGCSALLSSAAPLWPHQMQDFWLPRQFEASLLALMVLIGCNCDPFQPRHCASPVPLHCREGFRQSYHAARVVAWCTAAMDHLEQHSRHSLEDLVHRAGPQIEENQELKASASV